MSCALSRTGVVSNDDERGMRLLASGVSVVVAAYAVAVTGSVRVGWIKSRERACIDSREWNFF